MHDNFLGQSSSECKYLDSGIYYVYPGKTSCVPNCSLGPSKCEIKLF